MRYGERCRLWVVSGGDALERSDEEDLDDVERRRVDVLVWRADHAAYLASEVCEVLRRSILNNLVDRVFSQGFLEE